MNATPHQPRPRPYGWVSSILALATGIFVVSLLLHEGVARSLLAAVVAAVVVQIIGRLVDRSNAHR